MHCLCAYGMCAWKTGRGKAENWKQCLSISSSLVSTFALFRCSRVAIACKNIHNTFTLVRVTCICVYISRAKDRLSSHTTHFRLKKITKRKTHPCTGVDLCSGGACVCVVGAENLYWYNECSSSAFFLLSSLNVLFFKSVLVSLWLVLFLLTT